LTGLVYVIVDRDGKRTVKMATKKTLRSASRSGRQQTKFHSSYISSASEDEEFATLLYSEMHQNGSKPSKPVKFFISYPRSRPWEADFVEMTLRRRNLSVFRDERDFGPGKSIPREISEKIYESDVFVAIYCTEYACSPWCFDELDLALSWQATGGPELWLLLVDEARIVHPAARELTNYPARSRVELEGQILRLIEGLNQSRGG
jgi:TIR domain